MKSVSIPHILGLGFLLLALNFFGHYARAAEGAIHCETAYGEKSFRIEDERVVFTKEVDAGRSISSVEMVRTEKRHRGFDKIMNLQGLKHRIHIENPASLSEVDDYMVITSPKGHEMTYPLSCRKA